MKAFFFLICIFVVLSFMHSPQTSPGPSKAPYLRIARIVVDAARLDAYKAALKEGMETAVRAEPGVLKLYALYAKNDPTQVTVFEEYASEEAYQSHIQTAHFKKYKAAVADMVKSLELMDVEPIAMESK